MTQIGYSYDEHARLAGGAEAVRAPASASVAQSGACHRTRRVAFRHSVPPQLWSSAKGMATLGLRSLTYATFLPLSDRGDLPDSVSALPSGWSSEAGKHYRGRGGQKWPANTALIGDHIDQARCDCRDRGDVVQCRIVASIPSPDAAAPRATGDDMESRSIDRRTAFPLPQFQGRSAEGERSAWSLLSSPPHAPRDSASRRGSCFAARHSPACTGLGSRLAGGANGHT
jgi:hypothetical protein